MKEWGLRGGGGYWVLFVTTDDHAKNEGALNGLSGGSRRL